MQDKRDWKFDPSVMEDEEYKEKVKHNIIEALSYLLGAGWRVHYMVMDIIEGAIAPFTLEPDIDDMRNAVNFARLWTAEHSPKLDQTLLDAIRHLSNAYYMMKSSNAKGGATSRVLVNVRNDLMLATESIKEAAIEMEEIITATTKGGKDGKRDSPLK
jgi:hypothetical protein